jgi:aminoglycoside phosphotransferase (APT) family kinase protein
MAPSTTDHLLDVLRQQTGCATLDYRAEPQPLSGGFWAELFALQVTGAPDGWPEELVARIMPDAAIAAKETAVQTAVAHLGFATPVVRAAGGPDDGLGRAFVVMDRVPGAPLLDGLDAGKALTRLPKLASTIPDTLAATMARLHRLNPASVRDRLPRGQVATTVDELVDILESLAGEQGRTDLVAAARWLKGHHPASAPDVICHGDLHPFNLMADDKGQITVLDWSAALIGPAAYDVAFTSLLLAKPPVQPPRPLQPVIAIAGRSMSRRFRRQYRASGGSDINPSSLRWHQGVVCLRVLVEVASWDEAERRARAEHPWLLVGPAFAQRLTGLTGFDVAAR